MHAGGNSTVSDNLIAGYGGGIYGYSGPMTLTTDTVSGNTATTTNGGGGFYVAADTVTLNDVTVSGNSATTGPGGGIYSAGKCTVSLTNSTTITDNTAAQWRRHLRQRLHTDGKQFHSVQQ